MNAEEIRKLIDCPPMTSDQDIQARYGLMVEIAAQLAEQNELRREQIDSLDELVEVQNELLSVQNELLSVTREQLAIQQSLLDVQQEREKTERATFNLQTDPDTAAEHMVAVQVKAEKIVRDIQSTMVQPATLAPLGSSPAGAGRGRR